MIAEIARFARKVLIRVIISRMKYYKQVLAIEGLRSITDVPTKENIRDLFLAHAHFDAFVKEHVPEVFPEETITRLEQERIQLKIIKFAYFYPKKDFEQKRYSEELRSQIIASCKNGGLRKYKLLTQICYRMICICPGILAVSIQVNKTIRRLVKRIIMEI